MGRSDYDNLRDLMDALDESYSSWMRDIRLAKARLIVPAQFLRRKPEEMFGDSMNRPPTFEFDEDVETLVALDTQSGSLGGDGESNKITPSEQMNIRKHVLRLSGKLSQAQDIRRRLSASTLREWRNRVRHFESVRRNPIQRVPKSRRIGRIRWKDC